MIASEVTVFDPNKHPRGRAGRFAAHTSPTAGQVAAGNYKKGHLKVGGLDVSIENPQGSVRSGTDKFGKPWAVRMPSHYGYIRRTTGADGDQLDVHLGPGVDMAEHLPVHVIDQVDPDTGLFDEHKVMIGYPSRIDALGTYDAGYTDRRGPQRRAGVTTMPFSALKQWALNGDLNQPLHPDVRAVQGRDPLTPPGRASSPPTFSQKPLAESGVPRRSMTRGESWQRNGRLWAPHSDEIPIEYTGSRDMERPAGSFSLHAFTQHIPPSSDQTRHGELLRVLTQHIQGEKIPTIVRAQENKLIPEGTPGSTIRRAYNHAAMLGLHDFGVGVYDFKMDDHLKDELRPLVPFMRYARRRINNVLTGREKGAWRPYREAFGQKFPTPKFYRGDNSSEERKRVPPRQEFIKLAEVYGLPGLAKRVAGTPLSQAEHDERSKAAHARWADRHPFLTGALAAPVGAIAGGVAADAARLVRGKPESTNITSLTHDLRARSTSTNVSANIAEMHRQGKVAIQNAARLEGRGLWGDVLGGKGSEFFIHHFDGLAAQRHNLAQGAGGKLWRGENGIGAQRFLRAKPGDTVKLDGFSSWTRDPSVANHYTRIDIKREATPVDDPRLLEFDRSGDILSAYVGYHKDIDPSQKVRVYLRGGDKLHAINIDKTARQQGIQREVLLGRGTHVRVDKVRQTKGGSKVVFATALGQDAKAAYRRGVLRRFAQPGIHIGRGVIGLGLSTAAGTLAAATHGTLWGTKEKKPK